MLSTLRPHDANSNSFRRDLLGAAAVRQVSHAAALTAVAMPGSSSISSSGGHSHLVVDGEIEVFLQRRWQVATINRVMCDGDLARHVKVRLPLPPFSCSICPLLSIVLVITTENIVMFMLC